MPGIIWNLIFWGIIIVLPVAILLRLKFWKSRREKMLLKIPGPDYNFLIGNALQFAGPREEVFPKLLSLADKYIDQSLFRLWFGPLPKVILLRANAAEVLLNSMTLITKGIDYSYFYPWLSMGLLNSTGAKWRSRRKLITPTFHFRIIEDFQRVFNEQAEIFVSILKSKHEGKGPFDIIPYIGRCALDIICETAMGKQMNSQSHSGSEYVQAISGIAETLIARMFYPWLHYEWIFKLSSHGRLHDKCLRILHSFTKQVIAERQREFMKKKDSKENPDQTEELFGQKRRLAFMDMLLNSTVDGKMLTLEDIREEVDTFMFEGHDTTQSGMTWTLFNIGRFPEIQKKIHEEIDLVMGADYDGPVTSEHLNKLKYLECVIKESMRLFPPVPFITRQMTEDTVICGHTIPKDVITMVLIFVIHRDPEIFPDPLKFDPDRFLTENCANRHPFAFIPFSAGPRNCIGQRFALTEEKVVLTHIMRQFKVTSCHKLEEIKFLAEMILRPANGMFLKLENRHNQ